MSIGWLCLHKYPPKRKCPFCGKRHNLIRLGALSNGADVWQLQCPMTGEIGRKLLSDVSAIWLDRTRTLRETSKLNLEV